MNSGFEKSTITEPPLDDIFGKTGNGDLEFLVSKGADWQNSDVRRLNVSIWTGDFDAIYASALRSNGLEPVDTSGHYDCEKFEKNEEMFAVKFPQFPMMVAFGDMYQDYVLDPDAVSSLFQECSALQKGQLSSEADLALRKLTYGCKEAAKDTAYLIFCL